MGMPPFPFSPPPFGIPPPMPPPNFSGLTTDELKAMEGNERENIEARVKCLRNVQVLLDAAVMEMQQYTLVVSRLNVTQPESRNTSEAGLRSEKDKAGVNVVDSTTSSPSSATLKAGNSESRNIEKKTSFITPEETGTKPKVKQISSSDKEKEDIITKMDDKGPSVINSFAALSQPPQEGVNVPASEGSKEADEVRRRRLAKFSTPEKSDSSEETK
jgi:E3 ubiquitin-protein ligase synoviolin